MRDIFQSIQVQTAQKILLHQRYRPEDPSLNTQTLGKGHLFGMCLKIFALPDSLLTVSNWDLVCSLCKKTFTNNIKLVKTRM